MTTTSLIFICPVSWGCRIHRFHLCRGVRLPQQVSRIWHKTIWWWGCRNAGALGNAEYTFSAIAARSALAWSGRVLSMALISLNCVLMLNWIVWNRTVYIYIYINGFGIKKTDDSWYAIKPNQTNFIFIYIVTSTSLIGLLRLFSLWQTCRDLQKASLWS